jgi:hypothetical protein
MGFFFQINLYEIFNLKKKANRILENMDESIDPCEDCNKNYFLNIQVFHFRWLNRSSPLVFA